MTSLTSIIMIPQVLCYMCRQGSIIVGFGNCNFSSIASSMCVFIPYFYKSGNGRFLNFHFDFLYSTMCQSSSSRVISNSYFEIKICILELTMKLVDPTINFKCIIHNGNTSNYRRSII